MSELINLVYGVKGGRMVHIRNAGNGIACGCTCPECGERLIARQGNIRAWHFAHASGAECAMAPETALHKLAKQWLLDQVSITLPELNGTYRNKHGLILKSVTAHIEKSVAEVPFGSVTPDVYAEFDGGCKLFLEVFVTHAVDNEKREKLAGIGIPTLELDLSNVDRDILPEDLDAAMAEAILDGTWAYHPLLEAWTESCREEEQRAADARKKRLHEASMKRKAQQDEINARLAELARTEKQPVAKAVLKSAAEDRSEVQAKRDALAAVYAKIEADRNVREEAERKARIEKAESDRAEYLSKDAIGRLLHHPRCLACGDDLFRMHKSAGPEPELDSYGCEGCGRVWVIDPVNVTFELDEEGRRCPDCGSRMIKRRGPRGYFYGCSAFPSCRRTCSV